ncbi:MAG TPA: hypothetical protein VHF25_02805, partial [Nitriliruptorales bacterium]|nr:hypothetical protein [Nitriliruptorales bacterium]
MTQVTAEPRAQAPPERPGPAAPDVDLRRALRIGLVGGVGAVFLAAIGMVQSFAGREVVDPLLTLGYLVLISAPFIAGYVAGHPPAVLEGYEGGRTGVRNVLAGLLAGLGTATVLAAFVLLADAADVRRV